MLDLWHRQLRKRHWENDWTSTGIVLETLLEIHQSHVPFGEYQLIDDKKNVKRLNNSTYFQVIFVFSLLSHEQMLGTEYKYPDWSMHVGYALTASSIICIPLYIIYKFAVTPGSLLLVSLHLIFIISNR